MRFFKKRKSDSYQPVSRSTRLRSLRCEPLEDRRMLSITLFVDGDAATGGDGLDWATAYDDLQSALTQSAVLNTDADPTNDVESIWIAEGTYYPTAELDPGDTRSASFSLLDDIDLYGGFAGTEATLAERDLSAGHTTTLSGDLGVVDDNSDNAYTVVYCGEAIEATLDGFYVVDGNANNSETNPDHSEGMSGGGIFNKGNLSIFNSSVVDNAAHWGDGGGGIGNISGVLTITDSTIANNSIPNMGSGGGILNRSGTVTIVRSTIANNVAVFGAGIFQFHGNLTLINSTISGNSAEGQGGGIYNLGESILTNCTIINNEASSGGGIYDYDNSDVALTLNNTVVAGNGTNAVEGPDIYHTYRYSTILGSYNLIGNGQDLYFLYNDTDGNIIGTSSSPIDPLLGPLQDNGGPTFTHAPLARSPLIDAGSDIAATNSWGWSLPTDQRGFVRRLGMVDIGAVEYQVTGVPVAYSDIFEMAQGGSVTFALSDILGNDTCNDGGALTAEFLTMPLHGTLVSNPDGTFTYTPEGTFWGTETITYRAVNGSLRSNEAEVVFSVISPQSVIVTTVDSGMDGDLSPEDISLREAIINLSASQIQFSADLFGQAIVPEMGIGSSNLHLIGLGAHNLAIAGQCYVYGDNATISDLTITQNVEAGVRVNSGATLLLQNALISNNGCGIANQGTVEIVNTTIVGNSSDSYNGGGGGIFNMSELILRDSRVLGNSVTGSYGDGGGIYNNEGNLAIINTVIAGNSATGSNSDGGGIYNSNGNVTITNSTISGNSAPNYYNRGGGIYSTGSYAEVTLNNTIVAGNLGEDIYLGLYGDLFGSNNLIGDGANQDIIHGVDGNLVGDSSSPIDPLFVQNPSIASYGDLRLLPESPAVDAGSNALAVDEASNPLLWDICGEDCSRINAGTVDIGAFEAFWINNDTFSGVANQPTTGTVTENERPPEGWDTVVVDDVSHGTLTLAADGTFSYTPDTDYLGMDSFTYRYCGTSGSTDIVHVTLFVFPDGSFCVNTLDDELDTDYDPTDLSLREALYFSRLKPGDDVIEFTPSLANQQITLDPVLGELTLDSNVFVSSSSAITISANGASRVFSATGGATAAIEGLTITGGNSINGGGVFYRYGGGIFNDGSDLIITNCIIADNTAGYCGGIFNKLGNLTITNSTIAGNFAESYAAIVSCGNTSPVTLNNTIVAKNISTSGTGDIQGANTSPSLFGSNNLIGNGTGQSEFVHGVNGNLVGTAESPIDPKLDTTGMPLPDSPVINAGNNNLLPSEITTDLAGNPRILDGTVDIGAYEFDFSQFLPGDANGDGKVDGSDVTILANHWQVGVSDGETATWAMGDFNGDGKVDGSDVTILASNWQADVNSTVATVSEEEPEEEPPVQTDPTQEFTPPAKAELGVATVPRRESMQAKQLVRPIVETADEATDVELGKQGLSESDLAAIAKDILVATPAKKSIGVHDELFAVELGPYDDLE